MLKYCRTSSVRSAKAGFAPGLGPPALIRMLIYPMSLVLGQLGKYFAGFISASIFTLLRLLNRRLWQTAFSNTHVQTYSFRRASASASPMCARVTRNSTSCCVLGFCRVQPSFQLSSRMACNVSIYAGIWCFVYIFGSRNPVCSAMLTDSSIAESRLQVAAVQDGRFTFASLRPVWALVHQHLAAHEADASMRAAVSRAVELHLLKVNKCKLRACAHAMNS